MVTSTVVQLNEPLSLSQDTCAGRESSYQTKHAAQHRLLCETPFKIFRCFQLPLWEIIVHAGIPCRNAAVTEHRSSRNLDFIRAERQSLNALSDIELTRILQRADSRSPFLPCSAVWGEKRKNVWTRATLLGIQLNRYTLTLYCFQSLANRTMFSPVLCKNWLLQPRFENLSETETAHLRL